MDKKRLLELAGVQESVSQEEIQALVEDFAHAIYQAVPSGVNREEMVRSMLAQDPAVLREMLLRAEAQLNRLVGLI